MKPLQRDILLSQKQRAFSKAVVLVAPEKRLLVVVLTAAVSSRSSSQCKRPVFVMLLPKEEDEDEEEEADADSEDPTECFLAWRQQKESEKQHEQPSQQHILGELGTMRIVKL